VAGRGKSRAGRRRLARRGGERSSASAVRRRGLGVPVVTRPLPVPRRRGSSAPCKPLTD